MTIILSPSWSPPSSMCAGEYWPGHSRISKCMFRAFRWPRSGHFKSTCCPPRCMARAFFWPRSVDFKLTCCTPICMARPLRWPRSGVQNGNVDHKLCSRKFGLAWHPAVAQAQDQAELRIVNAPVIDYSTEGPSNPICACFGF